MTATDSTPSPLRRALERPGFRRLFAAQTISRWGDTFSSVALVILVYRLTGSGVRVAGVVAFEIVPVVLLGFVAGAVVDRSSRRRVMIGADLGRALVAVGLVLFHEDLAVVYLSAFLLSSFSVFFNPAAASALPELVAPDEIVGANSAVWSGAVISQIALAPVAGALVAIAGPGPAFAFNALSFLASAALLRGLPIGARPTRVPTRHLSDIAEGLRTITASRFLGTLAGVQGLAALSAGATSALLVVLAEEHLDIGAGKFGLLIGSIGIGAGLGPLVLQRFVVDVRRPSLLFGPYLLRGVVDLVLAAVSSFGVALGALALYGVGTSTGNVTYNSVLQKTVPDRLRGRVFAFYDGSIRVAVNARIPAPATNEIPGERPLSTPRGGPLPCPDGQTSTVTRAARRGRSSGSATEARALGAYVGGRRVRSAQPQGTHQLGATRA